MSKLILIGWREFRQRVRSRGFILGAIGTPLLFLVIWAVAAFSGGDLGSDEPSQPVSSRSVSPDEAIGYVDQADVISTFSDFFPVDLFYAYANSDAAEAALLRNEITAYYLIPPDYRQTGNVRRVSSKLPAVPPDDTDRMRELLITNLLQDAGAEQVDRLLRPFGPAGPQFVDVEPADGDSEDVSLFPFIIIIAILIPLFISGGYLFQSLIQEKESRVIEILLVSVRPTQLLTGKLLGLGALTLVQYLVWGVLALVALQFSGRPLSTLLAEVRLSTGEVLLVLPYALGGFILYAALMAGIGALARDLDNSRTWMFIITLPMMIPIYIWVAIVSSPHSPLAVGLSLFPFSAPVAMLLRMTSSTVPVWQLGFSLLLLALASAGVIWLMARLFRAQTLLSGEALSLRRLWAVLRAAS